MNKNYEHRSCSPLLTAKLFAGATAGCRQRSSLVGTSRGSGGCWASAWLPKWGALATRPCGTTQPNGGMASLLGGQRSQMPKIIVAQKFGCGRMHWRADAGHSQKPGIFVHFALLHGLRGHGEGVATGHTPTPSHFPANFKAGGGGGAESGAG